MQTRHLLGALPLPIAFALTFGCLVAATQPLKANDLASYLPLKFKIATFDPRQQDPLGLQFNPRLSQAASAAKLLMIVQFQRKIDNDIKEAIRRQGGEPIHYLPDQAYLVRIPADKVTGLKTIKGFRWLGHYLPYLKTQPEIYQALLSDRQLPAIMRFNVILATKTDRATFAKQAPELGVEIIQMNTGSLLMEVEATAQQTTSLLNMPQVVWLDLWTGIELDINNARKIGGANKLEQAHKNSLYTGIGIRGHVLEGITPDHPDFAANSYRQAPIGIDNTDSSWHGHNTYGIIFGSGAGRADARGLLPNAQGYFTNYNAIYSGNGRSTGSRFELVQRLQSDHRIVFETASWGYARTTDYDARSLEMDDIIFHLDIPITQSQSNAGARPSRPQAWAKNIISVGALRHLDNDNPKDDTWRAGGSIGPATDGRIKPDLSAFFDKTLTTNPTGYNENFGGTSGATPTVAGFVGLTIELWTDGIFGNTLAVPQGDRFDNRPHFTTVKALLINSARQWQFAGATHDRTRVHQGWGFPDIDRLFQNRQNMLVVDETDLLELGDIRSYQVTVAENTPELKATMIFADPPGSVSAGINRVNNLDLKITSPDGQVYWGNFGLLENMYSRAGGVANTIDPVENVFVQNPLAGTWTIEVIADEINADGHLETPEDDADFALVVSGVTP